MSGRQDFEFSCERNIRPVVAIWRAMTPCSLRTSESKSVTTSTTENALAGAGRSAISMVGRRPDSQETGHRLLMRHRDICSKWRVLRPFEVVSLQVIGLDEVNGWEIPSYYYVLREQCDADRSKLNPVTHDGGKLTKFFKAVVKNTVRFGLVSFRPQ